MNLDHFSTQYDQKSFFVYTLAKKRTAADMSREATEVMFVKMLKTSNIS